MSRVTDKKRQHKWTPTEEDPNKVFCEKCGIVVHINTARRGVGECKGETDGVSKGKAKKHTPKTIIQNLPKLKPFVPSSEDHGVCTSCGEKLKEIPLNSKLAMVCCTNRRCPLYRQRLKTFTRK